MRSMVIGVTLSMLLSGASGLQAETPAKFSGIKLVDMQSRTPEQTVSLVFQRDSLHIVEASGSAPLKTFKYGELNVTHTVSSAPPASAGNPSAAATQPMAPPMYLGKTPRNWLTLSASGDLATLRVSARVYEQVKAALEEHRVTVASK